MFENLTIRQRISGLVGAGIVVALLLAGSSLYSLNRVSFAIGEVLDVVAEKMVLNRQFGFHLGYSAMTHHFKNYVLRGDQRYYDAARDRGGKVLGVVKAYRAVGNIAAVEAESLEKIEEVVREYDQALDTIRDLRQQGRSIQEIDKAVKIDDGPYAAALAAITNHLDQRWNAKSGELRDLVAWTQTLQIVVAALAVGLLGVLGMFTLKSILRPLALLLGATKELVKGNLTERVELNQKNELGELAAAFNEMAANLGGVAQKTREMVSAMTTTLEEVTGAVGSQSSGASEQAASVNQTTTTLEEIKSTSKQTLDKTTILGEAAERTRQEGEKGLEMIGQTVEGMQHIRDKVETIAETILTLNEQTKQIGEITSVVTDLSQQLKTLAFNASIEAAKAGESGKGFAIVAAEVKDLAEQSERSTAQVQSILEEVQRATERSVMATEEGTKQVDLGVGLVEETGATVKSLSEVIHDTAVASKQIEAAVKQEVTGIDQVSTAMGEINQVTSQFVAATQQTKKATEDLAKISRDLQENVSVYKI